MTGMVWMLVFNVAHAVFMMGIVLLVVLWLVRKDRVCPRCGGHSER